MTGEVVRAMWLDSLDRLDSRASNPPDLRRRLKALAADAAAALGRDLMASLGLDEDAVWRTETGRDERGWTRPERERFLMWKGTGGSVKDASEVWARETRREFVRRLIADGRLGRGDEVMVR